MRLQSCLASFLVGLAVMGQAFSAETQVQLEQLQVPYCLAANMTMPFTVLAENQKYKIIELQAKDVDSLVLLADQLQCGRFINVSHKMASSQSAKKQQIAQQVLQTKPQSLLSAKEAYPIRHQDTVQSLLTAVDAENIWHNLSILTAYQNRSATKETGVNAAYWLKAQFDTLALESGRDDTNSYFVNTGWYIQPSLVTVIGKDLKEPAVVIGAHMDTLDGRMPGAGDDGSGSSSVMEIARVLLTNKIALKRPIYIIWYAAEERGLVGSQYVVDHFKDKKIPVKAAIQFDMTGYRVNPQDPTMWVFTDFVDQGLSGFVAELIKTYIKVPVKYSQCGYGCSDHASWTEAGVPSAFPCESSFPEHNPYIHSSSDTMDLLNLEHMANFTKLGLAFAVELAGE